MTNIFSEFAAFIEREWADIFGSDTAATLSAEVVTDIKLIGSGLSGALSAFSAITGLGADAVTKIEGYISSIESVASSVATTIETTAGKPIVTQIQDDFAELTALLAPVALPIALMNILKAVETLLPYVEAAVGILTAAAVSASQSSGYTADEARAVLKGL